MADENSDISKKKNEAIFTISQINEADFNRLLDAVILIANAAKIKTSLRQIGLNALLNEEEPDPGPKPTQPPRPGEKKKNVG